MNDKKIIIRNCPCFVEGIAIKGNEQKTRTCNNHTIRELTYCADITDCKLKQIVELCKGHPLCDCTCGDDILQLLQIEEVEYPPNGVET